MVSLSEKLKTGVLALSLALVTLTTTNPAQADFVNFQSVDVSLYAFNDNKLAPETTVSPIVEAFGDYSIGDMYVYSILETNASDRSDNTYYYKFVPRLSFSKIFNKDISSGIFKDVALAQWIAKTEGVDGIDYYVGLAIDWNLPFDGWSWFRTIFYRENSAYSDGTFTKGWDGSRLHIDFGIPFTTSLGDFRIVGTFDQTFNDVKVTDFKPELHYDLGKALGNAPGHLWTGIVVNPIRNKYGVKDGAPSWTGGVADSNQMAYGAFIRYSFW
ncbi:hypothetical protein N5D83_06785 [Pseudomonas chengduensis]|nr:outer membrane protein OmpK [Pseudomonas chengduensis]MDH1866522.1 hypothetical protein [Pseudomonas chengduensis]